MRRVVRWAGANVLLAMTILGLGTYAIVRLAYSLFYGPLDVTPEEVGLGYEETLAQSALALLALITLFIIVIAGMWLLLILSLVGQLAYMQSVSLVAIRFEDFLSKKLGLSSPDETWADLRLQRHAAKGVRRKLLTFVIRAHDIRKTGLGRASQRLQTLTRLSLLMPPSFVAAVVLTGALLVWEAQDRSRDVRRGESVVPQTFVGVPFLQIRAQRADVFAVGDRGLAELGLRPGDCFLLLGESGGRTYIYDYDLERGEGRTVRVASDLIAVSTPGGDFQCGGI
jgi:hypothetical protein